MSPALCQLEIMSAPARLSTTVFTQRNEILDLEGLAPQLFLGRSSTLRPGFFLASITGMAWIPQVVVVRRSEEVVGVVYAKERTIKGFPTGLVYSDATLDTMVVAEPGQEQLIFSHAVSALLTTRGIRGLRLTVPPEGLEIAATRAIASSLRTDISEAPLEYHTVLPLPPSYDGFVEGLRAKTRRNFRYYRRRSEAVGHQYVEGMEMSEFRDAAARLLEKSVTGADRDGVTRAMTMLSLVRSPLLVGLRTLDGELISIVGGWYEGDRTILFFQMNDDRDRPGDSLCAVLRGYLIERLIAKGITGLLFWAGAGHPYSQYTRSLPATALYLDRRGLAWRACRALVRAVRPVLPRRFDWMLGWIVPPPGISGGSNGSFPD